MAVALLLLELAQTAALVALVFILWPMRVIAPEPDAGYQPERDPFPTLDPSTPGDE